MLNSAEHTIINKLIDAVRTNNCEQVLLLLANPAIIETADKWGNLVIKWAAGAGHLPIVNRLLAMPAVMENLHKWLTPAIVEAVKNNQSQPILERFFAIDAIIASAHIWGNEALLEAARHNNLQAVECLLRVPVIAENAALHNNQALHFALHSGFHLIVNRLRQVPAVFNEEVAPAMAAIEAIIVFNADIPPRRREHRCKTPDKKHYRRSQ